VCVYVVCVCVCELSPQFFTPSAAHVSKKILPYKLRACKETSLDSFVTMKVRTLCLL
jgi:hypothetical protein